MLVELTHNVFLQKVLLVILITLLPLIPSYILFKFLPSESFVTGPFKGLKVNFSGATAIYFIIFIAILTTNQFWKMEAPKNLDLKNYEVWKVEGKLQADSIENYQEERFRIIVEPQYYQISNDGQFSIDILRKRNATTGRMEFPKLYISDTDGDYMGMNINIDSDGSSQWNNTNYDIQQIDSINTITINNPIDVLPRDFEESMEVAVNEQ
jgi:hypothetical protein